MGHPLFLYPNFSDPPQRSTPGAVLQGGEWSLPLTNMQTRRYRQVARSRSLSPAATWFEFRIDRYAELRAIVLGAHNLSVTAHIRLTGWYDGGSYYSHAYRTEFDAHPTIAWTGDLSIEDENWWDGKPLSRSLRGLKQNVPHILPEPSSVPNWRVEIFDEGNPAGYLDIGRLYAATGWQPSQAVERGPILRPEDPTIVETTMSGRDVADPRPVFRVWTIAFRMMSAQELLDQGFGLQRLAGVHEEIFFIFDPDDARNLTTTSFFARLRKLDGYELVQTPRANIGFEVKELL